MSRRKPGRGMSELGSMLGRWHQLRRQYTPERGFVTSNVRPLDSADTEEQLEQLVMLTIERTIEQLPRPLQLALQHVARAECMGVEMVDDLFDPTTQDSMVPLAMRELRDRLQ